MDSARASGRPDSLPDTGRRPMTGQPAGDQMQIMAAEKVTVTCRELGSLGINDVSE